MGYSGLQDVSDSDGASDLAGFAIDAIVPQLKKGLREEGNEFNTSGPVNVALFNEAYLYPVRKKLNCVGEKLLVVLESTRTRLKKEIVDSEKVSTEDWGGASNKRMHLTAYRRLLKKLDAVIEEIE